MVSLIYYGDALVETGYDDPKSKLFLIFSRVLRFQAEEATRSLAMWFSLYNILIKIMQIYLI